MSISKESASAAVLPAPGIQAGPGEYRLQAPTEIVALLRQLLDGQVRITLHSANGAMLNTQLCALDPAHDALGLDVMPQDPQLALLLDADEVNATAYLDLIRVAFELEGLMLVKGPDGAVLRAALPAAMHRYQRRQAFRVKPNTRAPQARLLLEGTGGAEQRLRIVDLSVGGLALLLAPGDAQAPAEGSEIEAQVELDRESRFRALLRLQHLGVADEAAGTRLGFAWARIDPAALRSVQLFIDQTQKLNRLLRKA